MMIRFIFTMACVALWSLLVIAAPPADTTGNADTGKKTDRVASDKQALSALQVFIGGWRGVGMPKPNSAEGAWSQESEWAWQFKDGRAVVAFAARKGKYFSAGRIAPGDKAGTFQFIGTLPDGKKTETFTGKLNDNGWLVLNADKPAADRPHRITIRTVAHGKRLLVLYQKRVGDDQYYRIAQVGYTKKGSNFASDAPVRQCIVTGGDGDRAVTYKGKTYYVCCKGCAQAFAENPEKVLAEYRARKAKEAKKGGE